MVNSMQIMAPSGLKQCGSTLQKKTGRRWGGACRPWWFPQLLEMGGTSNRCNKRIQKGYPAVQGENAKQIRDQVIWDFLFFFPGSNMKQWIWRWTHGANHCAPKMEPQWWWFSEGIPHKKIPETFRYRNSMDNAYILSSRPSLLSIIHFHATAIPSQATRFARAGLAGCF